MALNNISLGSGFEVQEPNEPPLKTMEVPWQMLKPLLNEKFVRARQTEAEMNRSALKGVKEVDHFILRKTLRKFKGEDEAILKSVITLATADDQKKFELDFATSEECSLCGAPKGGLDHLVATCTKLHHVREKNQIIKLLPYLHTPVLRGIPPAMEIEAQGDY